MVSPGFMSVGQALIDRKSSGGQVSPEGVNFLIPIRIFRRVRKLIRAWEAGRLLQLGFVGVCREDELVQICIKLNCRPREHNDPLVAEVKQTARRKYDVSELACFG